MGFLWAWEAIPAGEGSSGTCSVFPVQLKDSGRPCLKARDGRGAPKQGPFQSFMEGVGGLRVPLDLGTTLTLEAGTPSLGLTPGWRGLVLPPPAFPLCFLHFLPCAGNNRGDRALAQEDSAQGLHGVTSWVAWDAPV